MSKPVTNVEIEDVLSSIRRLVSTSDRAERGAGDAPEEVAEKLVLTPALRVDEIADAADNDFKNQEVAESEGPVAAADEAAADMEAEEASDDTFFEKVADATAPDEVMDGEASDDADSGDAEVAAEVEDSLNALDAILSETSENSNEIDNELSGAVDEADDGESPPEYLILEDRVTDDEGADGGEDTAEDDTINDLQRRAAEFEAIVATTDDAWDPDGTTEDENAASPVGPLPWQDETDEGGLEEMSEEVDGVVGFAGPETVGAEAPDLSELTEGDGSDAPVADPEMAAEEGDDAEELVEDADIAKVMADLTRDSDASDEEPTEETEQVEATDIPVMNSDPDPAPFVFRSQSNTRVEEDAPRTSEADDGQDDDTAPLAIEEAMLDEDALRDMVSEIVRQELQGALGERITRNVRKLVRREIHRALASQELE